MIIVLNGTLFSWFCHDFNRYLVVVHVPDYIRYTFVRSHQWRAGARAFHFDNNFRTGHIEWRWGCSFNGNKTSFSNIYNAIKFMGTIRILCLIYKRNKPSVRPFVSSFCGGDHFMKMVSMKSAIPIFFSVCTFSAQWLRKIIVMALQLFYTNF